MLAEAAKGFERKSIMDWTMRGDRGSRRVAPPPWNYIMEQLVPTRQFNQASEARKKLPLTAYLSICWIVQQTGSRDRTSSKEERSHHGSRSSCSSADKGGQMGTDRAGA